MTLQIGDIRYVVYLSKPGGPPWVARLKLEGFSPGRRKARWRDMDTRRKDLDTYDANCPPAATPGEAITEFQKLQAFRCGFAEDEDVAGYVRKIIEAEALRVIYAGGEQQGEVAP